MKLRELLKQIQDACLNDGNLDKDVIIQSDKDDILYVMGVKTEHPTTIIIEADE